jgi:tetratricopeptide (TPR) repeat protein
MWLERARAASRRAVALRPELPEPTVAHAWSLYADGRYDDAEQTVRQAIERKSDCEGAYYLLGRCLFAAGRYQELADVAEKAMESGGQDYNIFIPIENALGALGKVEALKNVRQRAIQAFENHIRSVPEDARARVLLASDYAESGRAEDAIREANLAVALRPNEATVLYNAACVFCGLKDKAQAMDAMRKAWNAGFRDSDWARRDPDLSFLHGEPEFERLYPEKPAGA